MSRLCLFKHKAMSIALRLALRLAFAAAGSVALNKLAEFLYGYNSVFPDLYDAPLTATAAVFVVLFLALGVFDAARDWNLGWRRIAILAAVGIALAAAPDWYDDDYYRVAAAVWRVAAALAVPAAVLTVWSWFRWGPSRRGAAPGVTLGPVAESLAAYRGPVAVSLGAVLPLLFLTFRTEDYWTDVSAHSDLLLLVVTAVVASTAVLYAVPSALRFLAGIGARRRQGVLLTAGLLAAGSALYMGVSTEDWYYASAADILPVAWCTVMAPAVLVTLVFLVSYTARWASEGFAASASAGQAARPPATAPEKTPEEAPARADAPGGAIARRRSARTRRE